MKNSVQFLNSGLLLFFMLVSTITSAVDVSVTTFGITGTGDESGKLQSAFDSVAGTGNTLTIPSGMTITVTKNMFLYGSCSIRGLDVNNSSTIQCDADLNNDLGRQYWISVGINRHKGNLNPVAVQNTFNGSIKDLTIKATSNAKFNRAIFIFNTNGTTLDNVKFDFTGGISNPPDCFFGATESGIDSNWEPGGPTSMTNVTIKNSTINAKHSHTDSEGFGLANVNTVLIDNNSINNIGDDPIGCHNLTNVTITNNTCSSIDGRILVNNCTNATISGNYVKRVAERETTWYGGGAMIYAGLEKANAPAPGNITVTNNTVVIPSQVNSYTYGIRLLGVRTATVSSNLLKMDSPCGGCGIRIEADTSEPSWNDPAIPQLDPDHIARPRQITISSNILGGAYPGEIAQTGGNFPLETGNYYTVQNNIAGSYLWYSNYCFIYNDNILDYSDDLLDGADYSQSGVNLLAIKDPVNIYSDTLSNVRPGQTVPGTIYTATLAGRISGYNVASLSQTITGGFITLQLWKNGQNIKLTTISAGGSVNLTYNEADLAFVPGDQLQLKAVGASTLQPTNGISVNNVAVEGLQTTQSACYKFETMDNNIITDSSGCGNNGTVNQNHTGVMLSTDALNGSYSLDFEGNGEIDVNSSASLSIADNLSISFWIKPHAIPSGYATFPVCKWTSTITTDANYVCYFMGNGSGGQDGKLRFLATTMNSGWRSITNNSSNPIPSDGQTWTHVAMVYNSATGGQLYINGLQSGAATPGYGTLVTNSQQLKMGTGISSMLNAELDDVRIFNRR